MINISSSILAVCGTIDTRSIIHEIIDALEGNGDRLLVDGCLELYLVTLCDVGGVTNLKGEHRVLNGAGAILSIVRVGFLSGDSSSVEDVLEGVGWKSTIAAEVIKITGAVDELLLSVGFEDTVFDEMGTLEATDG